MFSIQSDRMPSRVGLLVGVGSFLFAVAVRADPLPSPGTLKSLPLIDGTEGIHKTTFVHPEESWQSLRTKLESAQAGEEIVFAPGVYRAQSTVHLRHAGSDSARIILRAQDPLNRPIWDGSNVTSRDCFQVEGSHYRLAGLVIQNCRFSNSAGVRAIYAEALDIRRCEFRHNTQGITGNGLDMRIELNHIHHSSSEDPHLGHNVYLYGGSAVLRHNHIHHSSGQNLHLRVENGVVEYNRVENAGSYVADLMTCANQCGGSGSQPSSQRLLLRGNVLDARGQRNRAQILALYKDQSSQDGTGDPVEFNLTLIHNTVLGPKESDSSPAALVHLVNAKKVSTRLTLLNNAVLETASLTSIDHPSLDNWSVKGARNWLSNGTESPPFLEDTFNGEDPAFYNALVKDYRPAPASPLAHQAAPSSTAEDRVIEENHVDGLDQGEYRVRADSDDIGAFRRVE